MKFIAFTGAKQSGKTTGFNKINSLYSNVDEITLAKKLKETCAKVYELPIMFMYDDVLKETELDDIIVLNQSNLEAVFLEFDLKPGIDYTYNEHIRPHIGKVLETPRKLLQYVGTDVLRKVDEDIHLNYAVNNKNPNAAFYVITDVRFSNEFKYFYTKFNDTFYPFYVNNKSAEAKSDLDGHSSEQGYKEFKHLCTELDNNGTQDVYEDLVSNKIKEIV